MSFDLSQIPSAFKNHEQFCQWLVKTMDAKCVVELGVDFGWSFFHFGMAIPTDGMVYGIDDYSGAFHNGKGCEKMEAIIDNILPGMTLLDCTFAEAAEDWAIDPEEIDILLIDGGHSLANVTEDFSLWSPFVRSGGVVLFHDLYSFPDGPGRFFNELEGSKFSFSHSHGLGVWTKP